MSLFDFSKTKKVKSQKNAPKPWQSSLMSNQPQDSEFEDETRSPVPTISPKIDSTPTEIKSSVFDFLKGNEYKKELEKLRTSFTPEMYDTEKVIALKNSTTEEYKEMLVALDSAKNELEKINTQIQAKNTECVQLDDAILLQSFGLYEPRYPFINSEQYKNKLNEIRDAQKTMIRNKTAVTSIQTWYVNNSIAQGRKMVNNTQKLLLRAFNCECDEVVNKVKFNNIESAEKRIKLSCNAISNLGRTMQIEISKSYYDKKIEELYLSYEYQQMKQKEKERQAELREQAREEAKLKKEIADALKNLKKEHSHYTNALEKINKQILNNEHSEDLTIKKCEIEQRLADIDKAEKEVDYRAANMRAGYVYIISNIGSFGENVYKIGMTRRLDPTERVQELGDASVPYKFDIHAMIFSEDAPKLENALHKAFENRKMNLVNQRREFFKATLDEIKDVVNKNYEKTAEFIELPDAEQFRISEKMRIQLNCEINQDNINFHTDLCESHGEVNKEESIAENDIIKKPDKQEPDDETKFTNEAIYYE